MTKVDGGSLLIHALRRQGVEVVFQLLGDPLQNVAMAAHREGMRCCDMRHEQGVAMAAQAYGYVSRRIGVGLVASGPAMTNTVTGLGTAWANGWPLLVIGGSSELAKRGLGDFQEMPQVRIAAPLCKWSACVDRVERIPWFVEQAVHTALSGRPGPVYLDLPADVLAARVEPDAVSAVPAAREVARPAADPARVAHAVERLRAARRPLLILGKGAAWADASGEARALVERFGLAFVASPMGKGVVPDDHPLSFGAARSHALRHADLVLVVGARLNWTFHFGQPPRFAPDVEVIHVDIEADEIGRQIPGAMGLVGDAKVVLRQILDATPTELERGTDPEWIASLERERSANVRAIDELARSEGSFTHLYRLLHEIRQVAGDDALLVADGENTAAAARALQSMRAPRERLDPGTSGCMGVGVPYAIGVQVARPDRRVVAVLGDYAFGWNAMEIETAVRLHLPIVFVVANNGTVRPGAIAFDNHSFVAREMVRYDRMMEAVGGVGENVEHVDALRPALERAFASGRPALVNVAIDPHGRRKPQAFRWLDREGAMSY